MGQIIVKWRKLHFELAGELLARLHEAFLIAHFLSLIRMSTRETYN